MTTPCERQQALPPTLDAVLPAARLTMADLAPPETSARTLSIVATYRYADETGLHLYDVVRFHPKDFRQRRADETWSMQGARRVLYRLSEARRGLHP